MIQIPRLEEMLKAGLHFGHKSSRWHPKMASFIFGAKGGVHIVDLEVTRGQLERAAEFLKGVAARGGVVLFVASKPQAHKPIEEAAVSCGMPWVNERWLGGTLTNYNQIKIRLKELKSLKERRDKGELRKYTKKEQLMITRQIADMQKKFGGIEQLERVPEAVFIVDIKTEKTALCEAVQTGVPVVAVCDTNVNPDGVNYVIAGNDDASRGIDLIGRLMAAAINEGKANPVKVAEPVVAKKPLRVMRKMSTAEEKAAKTKEVVE